jgi:glycosyltransferase involved in cell wall biosynthesis
MVTSRVGGFVDQITDGDNGFFIDITRPETISQTLQQILALPQEVCRAIRRRAYEKVVQQYDFRQNFPRTLAWFWEERALTG